MKAKALAKVDISSLKKPPRQRFPAVIDGIPESIVVQLPSPFFFMWRLGPRKSPRALAHPCSRNINLAAT
ncbi:hypothetical protein ACFSOZ_22675 [Mesorhizobium newzealandense]|uniref:Uncharacterized protein n=3 Tax=Mesorhizobium TaxID=68287 RepID=A0ABV7MGZ2_9HYPH|nr:hypothetical protein [Mesorhizobium sophorae]